MDLGQRLGPPQDPDSGITGRADLHLQCSGRLWQRSGTWMIDQRPLSPPASSGGLASETGMASGSESPQGTADTRVDKTKVR